MRTIDLDRYWPSGIAVNESDAKSAAATVAALKNVYPDASARLTEARPAGSFTRWRQVATGAKAPIAAFVASFDARAAVWLSSGFVAGMAAWHAVGFWGFVSDAMLRRANQQSSIVSATPARTEASPSSSFQTGSLASYILEAPACVALLLHRETATTSAIPCGNSETAIGDAGRHSRGDRLTTAGSRLQDPDAWSTTTALNDFAPRDPPGDADFDLTLAESH